MSSPIVLFHLCVTELDSAELVLTGKSGPFQLCNDCLAHLTEAETLQSYLKMEVAQPELQYITAHSMLISIICLCNNQGWKTI